jgi:hypothetical protein
MKRRIFAWVLLAGFVLLILNLIVFRFYWQLSMVAYLVIVFAFVLTNGRLVPMQDTDEKSNTTGSGDPDDKDDIGRYLDDARVLKNDAVNEDDNVDNVNNPDDAGALDNDEAPDHDDDSEDK